MAQQSDVNFYGWCCNPHNDLCIFYNIRDGVGNCYTKELGWYEYQPMPQVVQQIDEEEERLRPYPDWYRKVLKDLGCAKEPEKCHFKFISSEPKEVRSKSDSGLGSYDCLPQDTIVGMDDSLRGLIRYTLHPTSWPMRDKDGRYIGERSVMFLDKQISGKALSWNRKTQMWDYVDM